MFSKILFGNFIFYIYFVVQSRICDFIQLSASDPIIKVQVSNLKTFNHKNVSLLNVKKKWENQPLLSFFYFLLLLFTDQEVDVNSSTANLFTSLSSCVLSMLTRNEILL